MRTHSLALALGLAALPSIAFAHISFVNPTAAAGRSFKAVLAVPHGCGGKATQSLEVKLPEGFIGAKPMPKPGWTIEIVKGPYARSYEHEGETLSSGPVEIRWTGGPLDDAWYDEFTILGTFGDAAVSGRVAFPVTQRCAGGTSIAWTDVADPASGGEEPAHPAPTLTVGPAHEGEADEHAHMHMASHGDAEHDAEGGAAETKVVKVGTLAISGAFARATPPGAKIGGGYLTITNTGTAPDRLIASSSALASSVAIHEMVMDGNVMRMRALPYGLEIPGGATVTLSPGGSHFMFEHIAKPFKEGDTVALTLGFEHAGSLALALPVGKMAADGPGE